LSVGFIQDTYRNYN